MWRRWWGRRTNPSAPVALPPLGAGEQTLDDPNAYSAAASAVLSGAEEAAAVTHHVVTLGGARIDYTARAGHLTARAAGNNPAQASLFYIAYTVDSAVAKFRRVNTVRC